MRQPTGDAAQDENMCDIDITRHAPLNDWSNKYESDNVNPGPPLHAEVDRDPASETFGQLLITYDWRLLWTLKVTTERRLERQKRALESEPWTEKQKSGKRVWEESTSRYSLRGRRIVWHDKKPTSDDDDDDGGGASDGEDEAHDKDTIEAQDESNDEAEN
jgi:hypothetical protein